MAFKDKFKTLRASALSKKDTLKTETQSSTSTINNTEVANLEKAVLSREEELEAQKGTEIDNKKNILGSSKNHFLSLSSNLSSRARASSQYLRENSPELKAKLKSSSNSIKLKASQVNLKDLSGSLSNQLKTAAAFSSSKVSDLTTKALHLDKDAELIVEEIKSKSPPELDDIDDIISHCKDESIKLILTNFALYDATMGKYDERLSDSFSNLSESYAEFDERMPGAGVRRHENFKNMEDIRELHKSDSSLIQDEFQNSRYIDASHVDIDHVIPTKKIFDDLLLKASTNDSELLDVMNNDKNLAFTFNSLNRSKNDNDFASYLNERGTPHPTDSELVIVMIAGNEVTVNKKEAIEEYEQAQSAYQQLKLDALAEMGVSIVSASGMMAIKQLTGHIIYETYDVFFDEIGSFHETDLPFETEAYTSYFTERKSIFSEKLSSRIKERKLLERAKEIGVDSFLSGVISTIPQLMISVITKLPAMVMGIIRECTNGVIKSLRVLLSKVEDKVGKVIAILSATISAVLGLYLMRIISSGLLAIPILSIFSNELSTIFTASIISLISLFGIYFFNKNKHKINFSFDFMKKPEHEQVDDPKSPQPQF